MMLLVNRRTEKKTLAKTKRQGQKKTLANIKRTKRQTMINKTLLRKLRGISYDFDQKNYMF